MARLSALDGWIDVCRTGTWTGMGGKRVHLTDADLDEIVDTAAATDDAPVVVGHPETDSPAWGRVSRLRRVGDRLQAMLADLHPKFREAVEAGLYTGRSVALDRHQGALRLRHLGWTGGTLPAVPGLAPSRFAEPADPDLVIELSSEEVEALAAGWGQRWAWSTVARLWRRLREREIERGSREEADKLAPEHDLEALEAAVAELDDEARAAEQDPAGMMAGTDTETNVATRPAAAAPLPSVTQAKEDGMTEEEIRAKEAELQAKEAELADQAREQRRREDEYAAAQRGQRVDAMLDAHRKAGRVLPADAAVLRRVCMALPEERMAFAAGDGTQESLTPVEALDRVLGRAQQPRVDYRELAGVDTAPSSPSGEGALSSPALALKARKLRKEAADQGEYLSPTEAVLTVIQEQTGGAAPAAG